MFYLRGGVLSGLLHGQTGHGILSKDYEIKSVYEENDYDFSFTPSVKTLLNTGSNIKIRWYSTVLN
jgi:hypothetical protein